MAAQGDTHTHATEKDTHTHTPQTAFCGVGKGHCTLLVPARGIIIIQSFDIGFTQMGN